MRILLLLIALIVSFTTSAQQISDSGKQKLKEMDLSIENFDLNNLTIREDLNQILLLDKKRKTNKTFGVIFSSAAVVSIIGGSILLSKGNNPNDNIDYADVMGGIFIAGGVIYGGVSIPFWVASKKREKERDLLLRLHE